MTIRWATEADTPGLAKVFHAAIREGPSPYSQAQRVAWMSDRPDPRHFAQRISGLNVVLAERAGDLVGFMGVEPTGYIDLAYILHAHRARGLFRQLYQVVENQARDTGLTRLWTHASLMAQPAFRAMGFLVIHHEVVARNGEELARALMEKKLQ
ncbi:GNAT family N-acetyltransferase [Roseobacter weihaiensis]|uniref:GNAT family N-acetyltransferase n=1 Tax=Roseobacter weihaiensis TaxID=2763262 RepID=UPI001D0A8F28|nr:GNAT family N-acetyltransferase [Roseobacter sp. H9]